MVAKVLAAMMVAILLFSRGAYGDTFPYDKLQPGDILLIDDREPGIFKIGDWVYGRTFTHSGLYAGGTNGAWLTYEALDPTNGVRTVDHGLNGNGHERCKWDEPGIHVAIGRVRGLDATARSSAVQRTYAAFGDGGKTPYHLWPPWDKDYLANGIYCSQLVWLAYAWSGVDLDSNNADYLGWFALKNWYEPLAGPVAYFAVFPDELRASGNIDWYYDQVNASTTVAYQSQVQDIGWMNEVTDGNTGGTTGQSRRMEAIRIWSPGRHITYQAHVQDIGWMDEVADGQVAGTVGQSRRMEAIQIRVDHGHVWYKVHVEGYGWMDPVHDGAIAGTIGQGRRIEAIQIQVTD